MKWWDQMPWSLFFECWVLSQLFYSPLSFSSEALQSLFTFWHKGGVICISQVIDISPGNLDSSLCFIWPGISHDVPNHFAFPMVFPTQGLSPGLPHCRQILYQLSHKGRPKILEWVAYPFSSGSSQPKNQTGVSGTAGRFFTNWAMREAHPLVYPWFSFGNHQFDFKICESVSVL